MDVLLPASELQAIATRNRAERAQQSAALDVTVSVVNAGQ